jgi:hypothetical protein
MDRSLILIKDHHYHFIIAMLGLGTKPTTVLLVFKGIVVYQTDIDLSNNN